MRRNGQKVFLHPPSPFFFFFFFFFAILGIFLEAQLDLKNRTGLKFGNLRASLLFFFLAFRSSLSFSCKTSRRGNDSSRYPTSIHPKKKERKRKRSGIPIPRRGLWEMRIRISTFSCLEQNNSSRKKNIRDVVLCSAMRQTNFFATRFL